MAKSTKPKPPPKLPPGAPGRPSVGRYREQYGVILICENEKHQVAVFEGIRALMGVKMKVVVT